jgi:nicotinamidase/pyrazinamidase
VKRALIVVDMQPDFLPGGPLAVPHGDQVVPVLKALIASNRYEAVILTQDWHPFNHGSFASAAGKKPFEVGKLGDLDQVFWPNHCVQNTPGAALLLAEDAAKAVKADHSKLVAVVQKGMDAGVDSYSGFFDNGKKNQTPLHGILQKFGITDLDIGGLAFDYCVGWTAEDAAGLGYKVRVIEDATRAIAPESSDAMVAKLAARGIRFVGSGEI